MRCVGLMLASSMLTMTLLACNGSSSDDSVPSDDSSTASTTTSTTATTTVPTSVDGTVDTTTIPDTDDTLDTTASTTTGPTNGQPCGELLWAWAWAGENGEFVELTGDPPEQWITRMIDQSGNGHDYVNMGAEMPAYQEGYTWEDGDYSTDLPIVAVNTRANGMLVYEQYMFQDVSLDASGEFYLAFAGMNTRDGGQRELWGTTEQDTVRLDQERDRVNIVIDGMGQNLTEEEAMAKGPLLLEIWREDDGTLHTFINGVDASLPGTSSNATFALSGIGHDQTGTSGWDDYAFEYIVCDGLPQATGRDEVREYLRAKWSLY